MNIEDMLEINDCPLCDGGALLEEECGCGYYAVSYTHLDVYKRQK